MTRYIMQLTIYPLNTTASEALAEGLGVLTKTKATADSEVEARRKAIEQALGIGFAVRCFDWIASVSQKGR